MPCHSSEALLSLIGMLYALTSSRFFNESPYTLNYLLILMTSYAVEFLCDVGVIVMRSSTSSFLCSLSS